MGKCYSCGNPMCKSGSCEKCQEKWEKQRKYEITVIEQFSDFELDTLPNTLYSCQTCGALVGGMDGRELHFEWHKQQAKEY